MLTHSMNMLCNDHKIASSTQHQMAKCVISQTQWTGHFFLNSVSVLFLASELFMIDTFSSSSSS